MWQLQLFDALPFCFYLSRECLQIHGAWNLSIFWHHRIASKWVILYPCIIFKLLNSTATSTNSCPVLMYLNIFEKILWKLLGFLTILGKLLGFLTIHGKKIGDSRQFLENAWRFLVNANNSWFNVNWPCKYQDMRKPTLGYNICYQ